VAEKESGRFTRNTCAEGMHPGARTGLQPAAAGTIAMPRVFRERGVR
jgi:hypothetical protein